MRAEVYPVLSPEEKNVSSEAIRRTISAIREENGLELHSFLMLRGGALIHEEYFREGEAERLHPLYSITKSFMSTAIGLAWQQGLLSLEDKLFDFFPEHADMLDDPRKAEITLHHMLTMGSGYENNERKVFSERGDMVRAALGQPMACAPGERFNYYTLGSCLLSMVFHRVNPEGIHAYLKRKVFGPMRFGKTDWQKDASGVPTGGFGLRLSAYDMTKLGQLYLQRGQWEGQQLIPAAYVEEATQKHIENKDYGRTPDWQAGYGYQFWRNSFGGYRADGMYGQYIIVLPEKDAVIVMTSKLKDMQIPLTAVAERLLPQIG